MKDINELINNIEPELCKNEIITVLSQVITAISTDNIDESKRVIPKLIMDLSIYNQLIMKDGKVIPQKTAGSSVNNDDVSSILSLNKKKETVTTDIVFEDDSYESSNIISISELPSYKFIVYDGSSYTVSDEDYDRSARIMIPSTDGYDYWLKVFVSENEHILYSEKTEFEKEFPYIKAAYIREYSEEGVMDEKNRINELFDSLVDLKLLCSDKRDATYINNHIEFSAKPKSEQVLRLEGRRQSYIDNYNIRFIYDENSGIYHDKSCEEVRKIEYEGLRASENPPEGFTPCKSCMMNMLIRRGCKDDFKNAGMYRFFFTKGGIDEELLKKFFEQHNTSFRIESVSKLKVVCKDDSWKIETDGRGNFINLYHNSYTVDKKGVRHFDGSYHIQETGMVLDVRMAFEYIIDYDYKRNHK